MIWLAAPMLAGFCLYYFTVLRRIGLVTADSLFVYMQLLMAAGSLPLLDPRREADAVHGYILAYTLMCFMLVSGIVHLSRPRREPREAKDLTTFRPTVAFWTLVIISIAVVVLYYRAIGYSALFRGVANTLSGGTEDIAGLRLDSYSGGQYFFPGYVNQFKNVLLPALTVVAITYWVRAGKRRWALAAGLTAIAMFGLLGTGQRGAFVTFVATFAVFMYLLERRAFPRRSAVIVLLVVPVIILSTVALGRSNVTHSTDIGVVERSAGALAEFQGRILQDNQTSSVVGFRYIYESQDVQDGREWIEAIVGTLPGYRGSDLTNRIFAQMFGSTRGTAPPSIWGSIYHNFGFGGILVAPVLLALSIGSATRKAALPRDRNTLELIGIAGVFATLGFWVADTPVYLLNAGLLVYILLWAWGARTGSRERPRDQTDMPRTYVTSSKA